MSRDAQAEIGGGWDATIAAGERVRCDGVSKCYRMYGKPSDRLVEGCRTLANRLLGSSLGTIGEDYWALRDISFSVRGGESVAMIGRNGAGKSTLLQLLAGTLRPTHGSLVVQGRVCALLELGAGFHPEFTGLENIRTYASVLGITAEELRRAWDAIIAFADLGDYIGRPVKTYSSGMYVRLAFSVAIHACPQVLIVDEALAVGDIAFQAKCMARIRQFQESGGTLLFVSHDVAAVRALCQRAIYLEHGEVKLDGPAGPVVDQYLRDLHKEVNRDLQGMPEAPVVSSPPRHHYPLLAARFAAFEAEVAEQRQGTGRARIRLAEIVDEHDRPLAYAEFGATAKVRIWVECDQDCSVSVNYKIRDRNLVAVAGADLLITGHESLMMRTGELHVIEYISTLPLKDGDYTLRLSVTEPINRHERAVFLDIVEVAVPFRILPSPRGWIYTQVYLPNTVSTRRLGGAATGHLSERKPCQHTP